MLRKIGFTLLCAISCFCTPLQAMQTHVLQPGVTIEFDLPYNDPQQFVNYLFWSVQANCVVSSSDTAISLKVEVINKKITINDTILSSNDSVLLSIHPGNSLKLNAEAGAKARITNLQTNLVHAICSSM